MLLRGKRIFYVEDNAENRTLVQMILEQNGAKMEFERWGGIGSLFRLKAFLPVDLVLMDLMLPNNVTGYDVYAAIRKDPTFTGIPVAAVSAADPALEIPKVRAMGFNGFISKPIHLLSFPQQILNLINGEQVWYAG